MIFYLQNKKGGGMMEFLYRLYGNEYFGIGLFIVITILAFSFLVILFFGKKDEKERNKEIENNVDAEMAPKEELQAEALETVDLPVENNTILEPVSEAILEPVNESTTENMSIEIDPFVSSNMVLNSNLVEEIKIENPTEVVPETEEKIEEENIFGEMPIEEPFNIELNLPEESVEETQKEEETIDPFNITEPVISEFETPVIPEPVQNDIFAEPKEEAPKKVVMPTQFSSVYLTKEKEETPEIKEEQEEIAPIPLKPSFDLPKPLDLPKLNKESGVSSASNDNIIKPLNDANGNLSSIFENIEEDSYTIHK